MPRLATKVDRRGHRLDQAFSENGSLLRTAECGLNHRELVATQAGQGVTATQALGESLRHGPQRGIAGCMSEHVVDGFEMIQVDAVDADATAVTARVGEGLFQPVVKQSAI